MIAIDAAIFHKAIFMGNDNNGNYIEKFFMVLFIITNYNFNMYFRPQDNLFLLLFIDFC